MSNNCISTYGPDTDDSEWQQTHLSDAITESSNSGFEPCDDEDSSYSGERMIRFDLKHVEKYESNIRKADVKGMWYKKQDFKRFQNLASSDVKDSTRADFKKGRQRGYPQTIEQTYKACCEVSFETTTGILTNTEEELLLGLLTDEWARLGLEKAIVVAVSGDQSLRRKKMMAAIATAQKKKSLTAEKREKAIKEVCENLSRPCRLFARHLGHTLAKIETS